jgi:hypothetical protein
MHRPAGKSHHLRLFAFISDFVDSRIDDVSFVRMVLILWEFSAGLPI